MVWFTVGTLRELVPIPPRFEFTKSDPRNAARV